MSSTFSIGDLALLVNPDGLEQHKYGRFAWPYIGEEVEIIGQLRFEKGAMRYQCRPAAGPVLSAIPYVLRKRPPRGPLARSEWSRCVWQPKTVRIA